MKDTNLCIKFAILERCLHYLMIIPRNRINTIISVSNHIVWQGTILHFMQCLNIYIFKGHCQPGEYSATGLAPCLICPLHHYQAGTKETRCSPCSTNAITATVGAKTQQDCIDGSMCNCLEYRKSHTSGYFI